MTHHVLAGQMADTDIVNILKDRNGNIQTGYLPRCKILLGNITRNSYFRTKPILVKNIFI